MADERSFQNGALFLFLAYTVLEGKEVTNLSRATKVNGKPQALKVLLTFSGRNSELNVKIKFFSKLIDKICKHWRFLLKDHTFKFT